MPLNTSFEKETCGRCGGSGSYSYNQVDGSRCYGCAGKGERLTKRGSAAAAFLRSLMTKRLDEVQVGDVMKTHFMTTSYYAPVVEVKPHTGGGWSIINGERVPLPPQPRSHRRPAGTQPPRRCPRHVEAPRLPPAAPRGAG